MDGKRKVLMIGILAAMVVALAGVVLYYWYNNTYFIATEDATLTGDLVKVSPQISGKLLEFNVEEGDTVIKDQILGRQEVLNLADADIEQSVIRAPIDGIILKKQGTVGEFEIVGQTLAVMVDPQKLYVNANIEETQVGRVRPGQFVDITIDQFEGKSFTGKVRSIGQASNSTFSLLPASTSGTFTKVVQKIPVKIQLDQTHEKFLPGTNAVIKIHIQ
ncbi:HlyD family secretion protein [Hydrogenispora ethanolica]|uniref:HlyD family secretion protein n=1 Tax=Hydrogenispora ethanolica TaxID=1082276 RepID=A0A4R1R301_HYDET|nr:HlyD family efflux transporter periplasmic adaptor subunit [Hydrogenispora ethanolica]TCL59728.1 HlyD family secretion protein [Hydrogenispora ethanolica]